MSEKTIQRDFDTSADEVWAVLREFGGLTDWMPGVGSCEVDGQGIGAIRTVKLGDTLIREKLESLDDAGRSFSYSIVEGPLPAQNYLATVTVRESGAKRCHVDWIARFDLPEGIPEDAIAKGLEGAYGGALDALKAKLGA